MTSPTITDSYDHLVNEVALAQARWVEANREFEKARDRRNEAHEASNAARQALSDYIDEQIEKRI